VRPGEELLIEHGVAVVERVEQAPAFWVPLQELPVERARKVELLVTAVLGGQPLREDPEESEGREERMTIHG